MVLTAHMYANTWPACRVHERAHPSVESEAALVGTRCTMHSDVRFRRSQTCALWLWAWCLLFTRTRSRSVVLLFDLAKLTSSYELLEGDGGDGTGWDVIHWQ